MERVAKEKKTVEEASKRQIDPATALGTSRRKTS
jgi:hypothetical protein